MSGNMGYPNQGVNRIPIVKAGQELKRCWLRRSL